MELHLTLPSLSPLQFQDHPGQGDMCRPHAEMGPGRHKPSQQEKPNSEALSTHSTTQESQDNLCSSGFP